MVEPKHPDAPATPHSAVETSVLQALLVKNTLPDTAQSLVTASLQQGIGGNREQINTLLASASTALLQESMANNRVRISGGMQVPSGNELDQLFAVGLNFLSEVERRNLLQRQLCYALFDGVRGTDMRSTITSTTMYIEEFYTTSRDETEIERRFTSNPEWAVLQGMLSPELSRELRAFKDILSAVEERNLGDIRVKAGQLGSRPLSPLIADLLAQPETFYERLLLEEQVAIRQTVENREWAICTRTQTATENVAAFIKQNTATFVHDLVTKRKSTAGTTQDITWTAATPATRDCVPVGRPEFDLPIALLDAMDADTRAALRIALEQETPEGPAEEMHVRCLLQSLAAYEQSRQAEGRYVFDGSKDAMSQIAGCLNAEPGGKQETKCTRLWKEVFPIHRGQTLARKLIDTIGCIPDGFYELKIWKKPEKSEKPELSFSDVAGLHALLVEEQERSKEMNRPQSERRQEKRVLHARWKLLEQFFMSGIAGRTLLSQNARRSAVCLDVRGIRMDIIPPRDSKLSGQLHAHIPYIMASDAVLDALVSEQWISPGEREEVQLQRAVIQNDRGTQQRLEASKLQSFTALAEENDINVSKIFTDPDQRETLVTIINRARRFPASLTEQHLIDTEKMPDTLIHIMQAMRVMQDVQVRVFRKYARQNDVLRDPAHAAMLTGVLFPLLNILSTYKHDEIQALQPVRWLPIKKTDGSNTGHLSIGTGKQGAIVILDLEALPAKYGAIIQSICA